MTATHATTRSIRTATRADADQAMATLYLAFVSDPFHRWMLPGSRQYVSHWHRLTRAYCGKAFERGTAHYSDGFTGVATWLPPGAQPDVDGIAAQVQQCVDEHRQERVFEMLERLAAHEPDEPYWYLLVLGVDPSHQRQGIGSALLQHGLRQCDRENRPAFLVSSNPVNNRFYERYGFETASTIQIETSPPMWPMIRDPQSR